MSRSLFVPLVLFLSTPLLGRPCSDLSFESTPWFVAGKSITSLIAKDFDGDGHLDFVVSNGGRSTTRSPGITLFRGNGRGSFGPGVILNETVYVRNLLLADVDEDRMPDALVQEEGTGKILIFRNAGTQLVPIAVHEVLDTLIPPAVGDFNGDSHVDLVLRGDFVKGGGSVVFLGRGDGTFEKVTLSDAAQALRIAAYDLDRDGDDELITLNPNSRLIEIRYGSAGILDGVHRIALTERPGLLQIDDFDGDSAPDLLIRHWDRTFIEFISDPLHKTSSSSPQLWENHGEFASGDFSGDGLTDFVSYTSGRIVTGISRGNGTFESDVRAYYTIPDSAASVVVVGDFDENGALDIAVSNDTIVSFVLNRGGAAFQAPRNIGIAARAIADVNHDGYDDILTDGSPIVWFGNPDGTYRPSDQGKPAPTRAHLVEFADIDKDDDLDAVVVAETLGGFEEGHLWVLLGRGDGTFSYDAAGTQFGWRPSSLAIVDLDVDGNLDIVAGNSRGSGRAAVIVRFGNGDGSFSPAVEIGPAINGTVTQVGDLDGDGRPDILTGDGFQYSVGINNGRNDFRFTRTESPLQATSRLEDMNGDRLADWVSSEVTHVAGERVVKLNVRTSRGDGTFNAPRVTMTDLREDTSLDVVDMNRDTLLDVVLFDRDSKRFVVLLGNGDGTFSDPRFWWATGDVTILDIDRDGRIDVLNGGAVRRNECVIPPPARRRSVAR